MKLHILTPRDERWAQWLASVEHDFYHRPGYVEAMARFEGGTPEATLVQDGGRAFFIPYIVRSVPEDILEPGEHKTDLVSAYGYSSPLSHDANHEFSSAAVSAFAETMAARGTVSGFFRLHPFVPSVTEGIGQCCDRGETVYVDVTQDDETLWSQTASNVRNEIRKSRRSGLSVTFEPLLPVLESFMSIYEDTMRRVDAGAGYFFSRDYYQTMVATLGDSLVVGMAKDAEGVAVAASLFVTTGTTAQYHLSGSTPAGRKLNASKVILHEAQRWARARGATRLHLGGGVGAARDSLFRFKARFSPLRATYRTWHVIFDESDYHRLLRRRTGAGCPPDAGFFPRYRGPVPSPGSGSERPLAATDARRP